MQDTVHALKVKACAAFGVDPDRMMLWDYFQYSRFVLLEDQLHLTLRDLWLLDQQPLLLEPQPKVGRNLTSTSTNTVRKQKQE